MCQRSIIGLVTLLLCLSACVSSTVSPVDPLAAQERCLDPKTVDATLLQISGVIDEASSKNGDKATLLKDGCLKKIYRYGDYKIVIFTDPQSSERSVSAVTKKINDAATYTPECLAKAEADIAALNLRFADEVVKRGHRDIVWRWNDMDMGSVFWLRCGSVGSKEYHESLATLIHETTHDLRRDSCLFSPYVKDHLCFDLPPQLPPRSIAAYPEFPFRDPVELEAYKTLQNIYLGKIDAGPFLLFDELNAYTATTGIYTGLVVKSGKATIFDANGKRPAIFLTAFMAYTVRYLNTLKDQHHRLYEQAFEGGGGRVNRQHVTRLLADAEKAYAGWTKILMRAGEKPKDSETWFLTEYRRGRSQLGW